MNDLLAPIQDKIIDLKLNGKAFYYLYHNDRVYLIRIVENGDDFDLIKNYLASFSHSSVKQTVINEIKVKSSDVNIDIQAILWDLYFVLINPIADDKMKMSPEIRNSLERDKFVARKIIIEGTKDEIQSELEAIFNINNSLPELINGLQSVFFNDKPKLLADIIQSEHSIVENELKARHTHAGILDFGDVLSYLNDLKMEYDKF